VAADRAIVTDVPGTTRDVVSETANLDGIPIRFFDTAGVRETTDQVESIGVTRTIETLSEADLALFVVDGSAPRAEEDFRLAETIRDIPHLVVANKCDLGPSSDAGLAVSAKTGEGLEALRDAIRDFVGGNRGESVGDSVLTSARQSEAVLRAIAALQVGETALRAGTPHEMALLDLYAGLSALNELTGETTTEDILGRIFSTFCIGK
jgi:tRNA modification GTPase